VLENSENLVDDFSFLLFLDVISELLCMFLELELSYLNVIAIVENLSLLKCKYKSPLFSPAIPFLVDVKETFFLSFVFSFQFFLSTTSSLCALNFDFIAIVISVEREKGE
jgi:hypothetical protein